MGHYLAVGQDVEATSKPHALSRLPRNRPRPLPLDSATRGAAWRRVLCERRPATKGFVWFLLLGGSDGGHVQVGVNALHIATYRSAHKGVLNIMASPQQDHAMLFPTAAVVAQGTRTLHNFASASDGGLLAYPLQPHPLRFSAQ